MVGGTSATARRWAWLLGTPSIGMLIGALALMFVDRDVPPTSSFPSWSFADVLDILGQIPLPAFGILLAVRRPANRVGWLFLVAGLGAALAVFGGAWAVHALLARPGLPGGLFFAWLSKWIWPFAVCALPFVFLWFPTGRLKSPRWRVVAWLVVAAGIGLLAVSLIIATATWRTPFSEMVEGNTAADAVVLGLLLVSAPLFVGVVVASVVSAVLRFRAATGDERLQLKWFVTAAAILGVTFPLEFLLDNTVVTVLGTLSLLALYAAIAIAILKYRLYDIDVVIGKTVVFATLVAFITVVYVALVVGVGTLVGSRGSPLLSALAAALVAVAFQPVRQWARRLANRVVYGKRATPYEVLSDFASRAADTYSTEDVLPRMVRILAEGIGATEARVWLHVGSELRVAASWPVDGDRAPVAAPGSELPAFPEPERAFPVRHGAELLGAITVVTPAAEPLAADRERLLGDVAAQTALVLRNVRLIEELRESRRRIVTAQDERAKALERNLHDGAQQQLVALAVKQRLVESLVDRDPQRVKTMLAEIQAETQDALETLRDLARGVYPPLLADQGLGAALAAQARKAAVPVAVEADGIGRYRQDVEATVYFCCLEALQNVAKYAEANRATIRLSAGDDGLVFEVRDDGVGFDPASAGRGSGLQGMADRLDAIGGSLEVRSAPGTGTAVVGRVPGRSLETRLSAAGKRRVDVVAHPDFIAGSLDSAGGRVQVVRSRAPRRRALLRVLRCRGRGDLGGVRGTPDRHDPVRRPRRVHRALGPRRPRGRPPDPRALPPAGEGRPRGLRRHARQVHRRRRDGGVRRTGRARGRPGASGAGGAEDPRRRSRTSGGRTRTSPSASRSRRARPSSRSAWDRRSARRSRATS